jgi:hypothetical protein
MKTSDEIYASASLTAKKELDCILEGDPECHRVGRYVMAPAFYRIAD